MHPTIAAGVGEHSNFKSDPWARLQDSFGLVLRTIYDADGERLPRGDVGAASAPGLPPAAVGADPGIGRPRGVAGHGGHRARAGAVAARDPVDAGAGGAAAGAGPGAARRRRHARAAALPP